MPTIHVDAEAAALISVALAMLEGALTARVARADPDNIISNSLILQSHKLESARAQLLMPEPPSLSMLPESVQNAVYSCIQQITDNPRSQDADRAYERLRGLVNAAGPG